MVSAIRLPTTAPRPRHQKRGGPEAAPLVRHCLGSEEEVRRNQGGNPAQLDLEIRCGVAIHIAADDHIRARDHEPDRVGLGNRAVEGEGLVAGCGAVGVDPAQVQVILP